MQVVCNKGIPEIQQNFTISFGFQDVVQSYCEEYPNHILSRFTGSRGLYSFGI